MFLKFNPILDSSNINSNVILFHIDALHDKKQREYIHNNEIIKNMCRKKKDLLENMMQN